ncbi:MAG: nitroreductase family protein [Desulforhopalus sp.]|nr:nitroreductase family protein [Desulforhopalus sp.]
MNETIDTILDRKSVRKFTETPISKQQLTTLARAAMAAPSAVNRQPWEIIIVTEQALLKKLGAALAHAKMTAGAAAAFVICGNMERTGEGAERELWVQDCCAASENLLIAVTSMGLGAVWTAAFPFEDRMASVRQILGLPEGIVPLNVIPMGYAAAEVQGHDKFDGTRLHWEGWK